MTDPLLQKMADEKKAHDKEFLAKLAQRQARDDAHYRRATQASQLRDDEKQAQAARAMLAALIRHQDVCGRDGDMIRAAIAWHAINKEPSQ